MIDLVLGAVYVATAFVLVALTEGARMIGYVLVGGFAVFVLVLFAIYMRKAARGERW